MTPLVPPALVNHLWQSTLFVLIVWLATLALRNNGARVRCWLWTAASLKCLIPFSMLSPWANSSSGVPRRPRCGRRCGL